MGIEVLIIVVIILGILGVSYYLFSNPKNSETLDRSDNSDFGSEIPNGQAEPKRDDGVLMGGLFPDTEEEIVAQDESNKRERKESISSATPTKPKPVPPPAPAPGSAPYAPSQPGLGSSRDGLIGGDKRTLYGGVDIADKEVDEDDEFMDTGAAIPDEEPEPESVIEDILTTESEDKLDKKKAKQKPSVGGQSPDEIKGWMDDLKEQVEEAEEEMPSLEGSDIDDTLDTSYPEKKTAPATTAHFSAFYPKEAQAEQRYGVYIYAHAESMLAKITDDAQKFKEELGGHVPQPRIAKTSKSLVHGTKITVLLESEEIEFEPELLTKRWQGDWTRYEFEFRPNPELMSETAFVRASIMVMGFEIAKIKFAIDITEPQMQAMAMPAETKLPTNPFARAKMQSATTAGYDKIFISYSRKDKMIAEAFKIIQEAAGNDVFFDVDDIRTGEDWQAAIARAIDEADYLQLFWSEHSANSEWCGYEWEYTLNYRCQENKCREFIRPVWWNAPMPPPPESLGHLNFRRMDVEKLMQVDEE